MNCKTTFSVCTIMVFSKKDNELTILMRLAQRFVSLDQWKQIENFFNFFMPKLKKKKKKTVFYFEPTSFFTGSLAAQSSLPDVTAVQRRLVHSVHAAEPRGTPIRSPVARQLRCASRLVLQTCCGHGNSD